MEKINLSEYISSMGILIDVRHPIDYKREHDNRAINIYADKLLSNPSKYLDKNKRYFIICKSGYLSKRVVVTLKYLGYMVTQVIN